MMIKFNFYCPTRVYFKAGGLNSISRLLKGYEKIALVTTKGFDQKYDYVKRTLELLKDRSITVINKVSPNPKVEEIVSLTDDDLKTVDAVVGIGGGSAIDAAKAVSVWTSSSINIGDYLEDEREINFPIKPIIAIPTTAGTGSELSKAAILTSLGTNLKGGLRGEPLFPSIAIVDPELTLSVSPSRTAETGFDVFAHALETFISKKSNRITEMFSIEALRIVFKILPALLKTPENLAYRTEMMYASMLMGYNLAHSSNCLPHRLQYPIGAKTDVSHPLGLAAIYPAWVKNTFYAAEEKFKIINGIYADIYKGSYKYGIGYEFVEDFIDRIGLGCGLKNLGLKESDIPGLLTRIRGSLDNDPGYECVETVEKIYQESL